MFNFWSLRTILFRGFSGNMALSNICYKMIGFYSSIALYVDPCVQEAYKICSKRALTNSYAFILTVINYYIIFYTLISINSSFMENEIQ